MHPWKSVHLFLWKLIQDIEQQSTFNNKHTTILEIEIMTSHHTTGQPHYNTLNRTPTLVTPTLIENDPTKSSH